MQSTENVCIGLTLLDITMPFCIILSKAAEEKAAELGIDLVAVYPATHTAAEQISIIEEFVR